MCRKSVGRFYGSGRLASKCVDEEKNADRKQDRDRAVAPISDESPIIDGTGMCSFYSHAPGANRAARRRTLPRCLMWLEGVAQFLTNIKYHFSCNGTWKPRTQTRTYQDYFSRSGSLAKFAAIVCAPLR